MVPQEHKDYIVRNINSGTVGSGNDNGFNGDFSGFTRFTSANAGTAVVQGWEFSYQQQFTFLPGRLKGFAVAANYTMLNTHGDFGGTTILGTSQVVGFIPRAANVMVSWRYRGFSARLLHNLTGSYIAEYSAMSPARNLYRYRMDRVNLGLAYQLRPAVSLNCDINNLFNEPQRLYRGIPEQMARTIINGTTVNLAPYVRIKQVADSIAAEAWRVYQGIEHKSWVPIVMAESELQLPVRRPTSARLEWAQQAWAATPDKERPANRREVYARETLEVAKFPDTVPVKLQAIRIGTLGIAVTPCEMFANTGLQIKAQSPLRPTFTITLANGYNGYLPTPKQHGLGGFETWLARSSYLEVQASEKIRDELLRLLGHVAAAEEKVGPTHGNE